MKYVRIYSGDDGQSHFEDVEVDLADHGPLGRISDLVRGKGVVFREVEGEYHYDFHNAPRRQFVVNLTGSVDIEVDVPFLLRPFRARAVALLEREAGRWLARVESGDLAVG